MQMAFSVIIPIFNAETTLRRCLDSLADQSFDDYELLLINDGSTDGTPAILDGYAAQYPDRIRRVRHEGRFGNARDHFFWLIKFERKRIFGLWPFIHYLRHIFKKFFHCKYPSLSFYSHHTGYHRKIQYIFCFSIDIFCFL